MAKVGDKSLGVPEAPCLTAALLIPECTAWCQKLPDFFILFSSVKNLQQAGDISQNIFYLFDKYNI